MHPVIEKLSQEFLPFRKIRKFSIKPGIYALFFTGQEFPLGNYHPQKEEIVYLGKTENSQVSRDERTHFTSGQTGSSTLRRTLGALLKEKLSLTAIPRNDLDFDAGRKSFYKFDELSEERLTTWMKDNLGLAFNEFDHASADLGLLEAALIADVKPVLNIDSKNPGNPHAAGIKSARKVCADEANQVVAKDEPFVEAVKTKVVPFRTGPGEMPQNEQRYGGIFLNALTLIEKAIDEGAIRKVRVVLAQDDFKKAGSRQSYSFNLEFSGGVVSNDISGSAVARDLARVLEQNDGIMHKMQGKHLKFNLDKGFSLWITNK